eukprot:1750582-Karenia_brevis.AAC.1
MSTCAKEGCGKAATVQQEWVQLGFSQGSEAGKEKITHPVSKCDDVAFAANVVDLGGYGVDDFCKATVCHNEQCVLKSSEESLVGRDSSEAGMISPKILGADLLHGDMDLTDVAQEPKGMLTEHMLHVIQLAVQLAQLLRHNWFCDLDRRFWEIPDLHVHSYAWLSQTIPVNFGFIQYVDTLLLNVDGSGGAKYGDGMLGPPTWSINIVSRSADQ